MAREYSNKSVPVKPCDLDNQALFAIGRLVRACAELEDIINLFICNLGDLTESNLVVLLGQTAISKRIEIAQYLAKMRSENATKTTAHFFNDDFFTVISCRNDVAHGTLLGLTEDGAWAFLTSKTQAPVQGSAMQVVTSYNTATLIEMAEAATRAIPIAERLTKTQEQRKARSGQPLAPHRKGRPPRKQSVKPSPLPQS